MDVDIADKDADPQPLIWTVEDAAVGVLGEEPSQPGELPDGEGNIISHPRSVLPFVSSRYKYILDYTRLIMGTHSN
ncbi:MAG: hypothetical protein JOY82_01545 [Streptosporangiaceae bacterium]|nr:hypothetical protein [Streptosporangiaceae bacterium]MBV9853196.1 hypothetical protein [Streptosporangiaceae bacterium]